jgi:hypothetical protein
MIKVTDEDAKQTQDLLSALGKRLTAVEDVAATLSGVIVIKTLREENATLKLRLERDAATYALMQKGMERQAELMDGLKQDCRNFGFRVERLESTIYKVLKLLEKGEDRDEGVAEMLREALGTSFSQG